MATRSHRTLCIVLVVLAAGGACLARHSTGATDSFGAPARQAPIIVQFATARRGDMGVYIEALGTVTPATTVNVYSQVSGQVLSVQYREGQTVRQGEALLDIDARPYQAQLRQARGQLERDRSVLRQAQIDLARYREAFAVHAVAKQTLDDQEQAVIQHRGTVEYDLGQVQYDQVQLGYCHITAPISGRIGLRLLDAGNTVFSAAPSPLAVITQLQPITVIFNVAEDHLAPILEQLSQDRKLAVEAFDRAAARRLAAGTLLALDNQIDTATGTVRFRAEFDNRDLALFPNQFVNTRLLVKTLHDTILIPTAAIQHNGTRSFVFVVEGDSIAVREVTVQSTDGAFTAVNGLRPQAAVALSSLDKLQDGTRVRLAGK